MEHAQDAGALPSGASDLKTTDPVANDTEITADSPAFIDNFYCGPFDFDHLDNFSLSNLDELKVSISPPSSQPAMLPPVSATATFALEDNVMDTRYQQMMQPSHEHEHELGNPYSSLTQEDAPIINMLSQSQQQPANSAALYFSPQAPAHEYMPAALPVSLTSPGKSQELPVPNETHPLYTTALSFHSPGLFHSESGTASPASTSSSVARILGLANATSPLVLPTLMLPELAQSLSQPVAAPTLTPASASKGRGRRPAATQPTVSAKSRKRSHAELPVHDDVSDSEFEDEEEAQEEKFDPSASTPAARRSRHTSSASHTTAVLNPDEDYKQRRAKNNEAVRKSRAKAKQKSQDQAQQLDIVLADNKRLKSELDHVTVERDVLRNMLQDVLHGQQAASGTTAASNSAVQEAVNAVLRQARQPHAGAGSGSPRVLLPPGGLRSPTVARATHQSPR